MIRLSMTFVLGFDYFRKLSSVVVLLVDLLVNINFAVLVNILVGALLFEMVFIIGNNFVRLRTTLS